MTSQVGWRKGDWLCSKAIRRQIRWRIILSEFGERGGQLFRHLVISPQKHPQKVDDKIGHYYWLCGLINQLPFDHKAKYCAHTFCYIFEFLLIQTPFTSWFRKQNCFVSFFLWHSIITHDFCLCIYYLNNSFVYHNQYHW
jgi:hypothetical protein